MQGTKNATEFPRSSTDKNGTEEIPRVATKKIRLLSEYCFVRNQSGANVQIASTVSHKKIVNAYPKFNRKNLNKA